MGQQKGKEEKKTREIKERREKKYRKIEYEVENQSLVFGIWWFNDWNLYSKSNCFIENKFTLE